MSWLRKWFSGEGKSEPEVFMNTGTTKREREVARLLNSRIPGNIVECVRFSEWRGEPVGKALYVAVDLIGGRPISGGYVKEEMNAKQQAEAIYKTISAMMR